MRLLLPGFFVFLLVACSHSARQTEAHEPSEAGAAFLLWGMARTFPDGEFHTEKYSEAMAQMRLAAQLRGERSADWEALGPKNIGGRTLCLAIHPLDTNILWAGSASGGIWKSTTGGKGVQAWQRVETGFPLLGVSAIAIDPDNPEVIYAGTGEVYNVENSAPNVAFRTTRGTYGIGILKSSDGGASWSKSLDWSYGQLRGVQDIKINPLRPASVWAATTEGLYRSWDAGATWQLVHNRKMAVDIEINRSDTSQIFVTHGSLDDQPLSGIFRSENGGASFAKLSDGLPASYSGKALLTICRDYPDILYASIGNAFAQIGLYKSYDGGDSWQQVSAKDVCKIQGWYSHDVAVHPSDPNTFMWVGIDAWKSTNSAASVLQKSYWNHWFFGQVPVGGPEGPPDYVHADIHRVYYLENNPNRVYMVCDGGIFASLNGGETFEGRNGGYQTQQFYANFSNSTTNPQFCIGGMQDNATAIYVGDPAWIRVLGGDGECTAIHPENDQIMYGSSQYLAMSKTLNGGENWYGIGFEIDENACFNGPFEISPSEPSVMYAGAQSLWRSDDEGENWYNASGGFVAGGDIILNIAVHPADPDLVFCSTAPSVTSNARVFRFSVNSGSGSALNGLPNRLCMDLAFDPAQPGTVYAVFAGFNTQHVWRSVNNGINWTAIDNGLPDVPANSILIDPLYPEHIYVGNDLGVWLSTDSGASWSLFSTGAPQAMLAMHLSISPADRKLRVATYGLGVWQTELAEPSKTNEPSLAFSLHAIQPNPVSDQAGIRFFLSKEEEITLKILDVNGKMVFRTNPERLASGEHLRSLSLGHLAAGTYGVLLETKRGRSGKLLVKI